MPCNFLAQTVEFPEVCFQSHLRHYTVWEYLVSDRILSGPVRSFAMENEATMDLLEISILEALHNFNSKSFTKAASDRSRKRFR